MAVSTKPSRGWVDGTEITCSAAAKRACSSEATTTGDALWAR